MLPNMQHNTGIRNPFSQHRWKMANFKGLNLQVVSEKRENKCPRTSIWCLQITSLEWIWFKPSICQENKPFWPFKQCIFPLQIQIHLIRKNFDFKLGTVYTETCVIDTSVMFDYNVCSKMMALVSLVSNDTCFKCMPSFYYIHFSET